MGSNSSKNSRDRRIVLLGKTGSGKSSAGNTIFGGKKVFDTLISPASSTYKCKSESMITDEGKITLIDTPGFLDTRISENDELIDILIESAEGIHSFLIVLPVGRFTEQEKGVCMRIQKVFSDDVFKYATVLFTHGDDLEDKTILDFVKESDELRELVQKCGDRCHVIDNRHWNKGRSKNRRNKVRVKELLKTIDQMVEKNGGNCYTNEFLQTVQKEIEEEKMLIRNSGSKLSEEEIHRDAKEREKAKLSVKLAGTTTDSLLGAVFGVLTTSIVATLAGKVGTATAVGGMLAAVGETAADLKDLIQKAFKYCSLS